MTMGYYKVIYFQNGVPNGKSYVFKCDAEFKHGDVVELRGHKKGMIAGIVTEDELDYDPEKIQPIVGAWKEEADA